jgi:transposase
MRPPARLAPWLSPEELAVWVREAPTRPAYQLRLAIWLTHLGPYAAHQIADMLQVSCQAVWLWVGQYNKHGPAGLERRGRGGRRWAFLSWAQEENLLAEFFAQAAQGSILTAPALQPRVERAVGRKVSPDYVYRLLHRHGWRKLGPRPRHVQADPEAQEAFKKNSPRSSRKR